MATFKSCVALAITTEGAEGVKVIDLALNCYMAASDSSSTHCHQGSVDQRVEWIESFFYT